MKASTQPLLLWDIDGTLLKNHPAGRHPEYAVVASEIFGRTVDEPDDANGGTDFKNLENIFIREGMDQEKILEIMPAAIRRLNEVTLREKIIAERELLSGVEETLADFKSRGFHQTLVTGNSRERAYIKLEALGIESFFDFDAGGFGAETNQRWTLTDVARIRSSKIYYPGEEFISLENTFIIGDTIHDINAAKRAGAKSIAVATGSTSIADLAATEPDLLIKNLVEDRSVLVEFLLEKSE